MRKLKTIGFCLLVLAGLTACTEKATQQSALFHLLTPEKSGVDFVNLVEENDTFNILEDEFMYNGGGVGIGDFNNDGLSDIYFTGNVVGNRLYINRGDMTFEDVTEVSQTGASDVWSSGVTVLDFNQDGKLDMYVSATHDKAPERRRNKLFINQGSDADGVPRFVDEAAVYGLADTGYTTQTAFFDYDLDGDLDLYLLHDIYLLKRSSTIEEKVVDGSSRTTDKLLRNNGDGTYTDVSREAGILIEGFGLGIAVLDVNQDDYPDLYISNDFITNDVLYVNNGDGTFTNKISDYIRHQSYSSMGSDVADINGDGLLDIMTLDMLPNTNRRVKQMLGLNRYNFYELLEQRSYEMQYVRNCLQLNNGPAPDGSVHFSDISMMTGVAATDWSWSVLFADYDNDRRRDIFISNGFPRDVTDLDFAEFRSGTEHLFADTRELLAQIPRVKIRNFFYRNAGNLHFEEVSEAWGSDVESFSNGAAYGDLDNDGDLDLVVNNINDPAFIYENRTSDQYPERQYLKVKLEGQPGNPDGFGAKLTLEYNDGIDYYEHYPYRGYISCVDPTIQFGLGETASLDRLSVRWPDGRTQVLEGVVAGKTITLRYSDATEAASPVPDEAPEPLFGQVADHAGMAFTHSDLRFMDFRIQGLLPHIHSQEGPGIAVGDVDGNGLEDFFVGNGRRYSGQFFLQQADGTFRALSLNDLSDSEDLGVLLFDADGDTDPDLYIASGSSEFLVHSENYRDRLFINDGAGNFQLMPEALPPLQIAGSVVTAADYDRDGDLDLFVGGRLTPQAYPMPERSVLLRNDTEGDQVRFTDVTETTAPEMMDLGMVSTALWTDYDNDGWVDLLVAGEWMPITIFDNDHGELGVATVPFLQDSKRYDPGHTGGWWNSIAGADFDHDGDIDYVLGNQGLNNAYQASPEKPLMIYAKDFDQNGSVDNVMSAWREGGYYPVHLKKDLIGQLNVMRRRFPRYEQYGEATIEEVFTPEELEGAYIARAHILESIYLENLGKEGFAWKALPREAQLAPVYGLLADDFTGDGHTDILFTGNNYGTEFVSGWHDASIGLLLEGDGAGNFRPIPASQSGFVVSGDGKGLAYLYDSENRPLVIAGQNRDKLKVFRREKVVTGVSPRPAVKEFRAEIIRHDATRELRELYYGSSFLSGSTRRFLIDPGQVREVIFHDYQGKTRIWRPQEEEGVSSIN